MYIFVTGTDTDAGKTYVSKGICTELSKTGTVGYLKPFQSGVVKGVLGDAENVGLNNIKAVSSYVTKTPASPLISAEIDGVEFELKKITKDFEALKKECDNVVVEGSGGLYVPVKKGVLMSDIIKQLKIPVIVVARPDLGTINHTLMTLECLINNNIKVLGIVISNYPEKTDNPAILNTTRMIEMFSSSVPVLDVIKAGQKDFSYLTSRILEELCVA